MKKILRYCIGLIAAISIVMMLKSEQDQFVELKTVIFYLYFAGLCELSFLKPNSKHEKYLTAFIYSVGGVIILLLASIYLLREQQNSVLLWSMLILSFLVGVLHIRYSLFFTGLYLLCNYVLGELSLIYMLQSACVGVLLSVISLAVKKIYSASFYGKQIIRKNYLRVVR